MKVAAVVLNWNGLEDTVCSMDSLLAQTRKADVIYLLDNGSRESDRRELFDRYANEKTVELMFFDENLGFAMAHNKVFDRILCKEDIEYIALLNNDAVAETKWLDLLLQCAVEENADMVASKMLFMDKRERIDSAGHYMLNTGEVLPLHTGQPASRVVAREKVLGACAGAALYSVDMIKKIGVFDEYFHTGYEDAELGLRACILNYSCILEPQAVVLHKGSVSINKVRNLDYSVNIIVNIYYSYYKLMPLSVLMINAPFILINYLGICLASILLGRSKIVKCYITAFKKIFTSEREKFNTARRTFLGTHKPNASVVFRYQRFFLLTYVEYFKRYILARKPTVFENY